MSTVAQTIKKLDRHPLRGFSATPKYLLIVYAPQRKLVFVGLIFTAFHASLAINSFLFIAYSVAL
ncbi:hypothetical protein [Metabacillus fastidiosus]|uniref:hypothetical protein n=1 Tax=Metabacillus fastidiosus TaxID=1458 RepID=UPI002DB6738A|nr:hypothetical protein [Metabacillus fastidiosus]MEC2078381.1 hypothetical protein [Metabacillus fastidiosus]